MHPHVNPNAVNCDSVIDAKLPSVDGADSSQASERSVPMIRFPARLPAVPDPFDGTDLEDWLDVDNVYDALDWVACSRTASSALCYVESGEPGDVVRRISYGGLISGVRQAANLFRGLGANRASGVAYMLPALPETQFVLWGAEVAGFAVPINFLLQPAHIADLMLAVGVKILVALGPTQGHDIWAKAIAAREIAGNHIALVKLGGAPCVDGSALDFGSAMARERSDRLEFDDRPAMHDVAAHFHTGGTTGAPKLVAHSHRNQLAAGYGSVWTAGLGVDDVVGNGFPMFHVAGTIFGSLGVLMAGAEIVILSGAGFRNPSIVRNYWRLVEQLRMTVVGGIPTAMAACVQFPATGLDLSRVRYCMSGGAPMPRALALKLEDVLQRPVREGLGMTECGGLISTEGHDGRHVLGSVGRPIPFCEVQIRRIEGDAPDGALCAAGEIGTLVVRGANVSPGYCDPAHTRGSSTSDGWLITGDLGYSDPFGSLFITGRSKDLIIRSGHNLDPAMIEEAMLSHPAVSEAAAVGMPDEYAGELPVVYVVIRRGQDVTRIALQRHAETHIHERPAWPKHIFLVEALPKTAVGKVYKPALREDCARRGAQLNAVETQL